MLGAAEEVLAGAQTWLPEEAVMGENPFLQGLQTILPLRKSCRGEGHPEYLVDVPLSWLLCSSYGERAGVRRSRHQGKRVSEQGLSTPEPGGRRT
jgi:hypothetical protein